MANYVISKGQEKITWLPSFLFQNAAFTNTYQPSISLQSLPRKGHSYFAVMRHFCKRNGEVRGTAPGVLPREEAPLGMGHECQVAPVWRSQRCNAVRRAIGIERVGLRGRPRCITVPVLTIGLVSQKLSSNVVRQFQDIGRRSVPEASLSQATPSHNSLHQPLLTGTSAWPTRSPAPGRQDVLRSYCTTSLHPLNHTKQPTVFCCNSLSHIAGATVLH